MTNSPLADMITRTPRALNLTCVEYQKLLQDHSQPNKLPALRGIVFTLVGNQESRA